MAFGRIIEVNYSGNAKEQWVYGTDIVNQKYMYFDGDILTSWQF